MKTYQKLPQRKRYIKSKRELRVNKTNMRLEEIVASYIATVLGPGLSTVTEKIKPLDIPKESKVAILLRTIMSVSESCEYTYRQQGREANICHQLGKIRYARFYMKRYLEEDVHPRYLTANQLHVTNNCKCLVCLKLSKNGKKDRNLRKIKNIGKNVSCGSSKKTVPRSRRSNGSTKPTGSRRGSGRAASRIGSKDEESAARPNRKAAN
jgi:hypothetical protein